MAAAVPLLDELKGAGFALVVEGDKLIVAPANRLTDATRSAIRAHKSALLAALEAEQLRHDYDERAGIAEHDGGLCRPDAEKMAFETALIGWLNNPAHAAPMPVEGHCAACADPLGDDAVPVLRPGGGHSWLDGRCTLAWLKRRRVEAAAALEAVGIPRPAGWTP